MRVLNTIGVGVDSADQLGQGILRCLWVVAGALA